MSPVNWLILSVLMKKKAAKQKASLLFFNLLGVVLLSGGILTVLFLSSRGKTQIEILEDEEQDQQEVVVDLQGAVEKPGVYKLKEDSRINDLLIMAGGLSEKADREYLSKNINLAQRLSDGIKIYIPFQGEVKGVKSYKTGTSGLASETLGEKININLAASKELEQLTGVGPATASKIIDFRQENGFFASIEEIMKVPGIGQKTFEKIKNQITV